MILEPFNDKAHGFLSELLDEAEEYLVRSKFCQAEHVSEYLATVYIEECGRFLENASAYLPNDERIAADIFLSKLPTRRKRLLSPRRLRMCAHQLAQHTRLYFPTYPELLRIAYLRVMHGTAEWQSLRHNGVLMLAVATLPNVLNDVRRELRRRGAAETALLVPDDVVHIRIGSSNHPKQISASS